jgi:acetylglutamate kinase
MVPISGVDLGYVGEIMKVDDSGIRKAIEMREIPVVFSVGYDNGTLYNLNADHAVRGVQECMISRELLLLTEVGGVYNNGNLLSTMTMDEADVLLQNGVANGGMGIKVGVARDIISRSDVAIHISSPANLVYELFTEEGRGTYITR